MSNTFRKTGFFSLKTVKNTQKYRFFDLSLTDVIFDENVQCENCHEIAKLHKLRMFQKILFELLKIKSA